MNGDESPLSATRDAYLDALASAEPTPGGGSAAATVGATGAALVAMVARITAGARRFAERRIEAETVAAQADAIRGALLEARGADESAYRAVVAALALPRATDADKEARTQRLQAALSGAAAEPLRIAELAASVIGLTESALRLGNANLASDLGCAAAFAQAAVAGAALNVRVNHAYLRDEKLRARQASDLEVLERESARRAEHVRQAVAQALDRSA